MIIITSILIYLVIMAICVRILKALLCHHQDANATFLALVWPITVPIFLAVGIFLWIAGID